MKEDPPFPSVAQTNREMQMIFGYPIGFGSARDGQANQGEAKPNQSLPQCRRPMAMRREVEQEPPPPRPQPRRRRRPPPTPRPRPSDPHLLAVGCDEQTAVTRLHRRPPERYPLGIRELCVLPLSSRPRSVASARSHTHILTTSPPFAQRSQEEISPRQQTYHQVRTFVQRAFVSDMWLQQA